MKNDRRFAERAIHFVLAAGLIVIPMIFCNGADAFRLPKELVFRAEGILLLMLAAFVGVRPRWKRPEFVLAAVIVGWSFITTAASTNRLLSIDSLITILAAAVIFIATCLAAETVSIIAVDVLMIGCCVNSVMVLLQELKIWTMLPPSAEAATHYGSVGLLGNTNDVGTFLAAPAIAAIVLAVDGRKRRRSTRGHCRSMIVRRFT